MVEASGPVVTPPEHGTRNALAAFGVFVAVAMASAAIYFWPERETADSAARDRAAQRSTAERDRPGDPGQPLRKPGAWEVPQPEPQTVAAEVAKPSAAAPAVAYRRRPQPSAVSTWTAPTPPPPVAAPEATPAASKPADDGRPTKLAGLPVMQAERIDDASWYLMPGEMIMCNNDQPLTERTGAFWTATIPEEKLSRDGARRLIPAMSKAFGKIVTGFNHGDRRLAGVITHITGPSVPGKPTVFIPIEMGQVGDDLGRIDMDGNVENDFWRRLGTVGAYAVLDAVARGVTSYASGSLNRALNNNDDGVNVNVGNFGSMGSGSTLAGQAYRQELNRQPGFTRPQAQPCTIMITKPIDFRKALQVGG